MSNQILKGSDFARIEETPDGKLEVVLQRMGEVTVRFENSPLLLNVAVRRDDKRAFRAFVQTQVAVGTPGDKAAAAALADVTKQNGGKAPGMRYILWGDSHLRADEAAGTPVETVEGQTEEAEAGEEADNEAQE